MSIISAHLPTQSNIKSDKFYPPQVDGPEFLFREQAVNYLIHRNISESATIVVEGQAGSGKTTTVKQYLDRIKTASVWYQLGPEDKDSIFFLQSIGACINSLITDCPTTDTKRMLRGGDFFGADPPQLLKLLLDDLRICLKNNLYLVFDDLQFLLSQKSSLFVLNYLLEFSPPQLNFILISRVSLEQLASLHQKKHVVRLGNRHLALNVDEVTDFFHQTLPFSIPLRTIKDLTHRTDGWIMGIRLFGLQMEQRQAPLTLPAAPDSTNPRPLLKYFRDEIFNLLEQDLHKPLFILSLLENIPVSLATALTGKPDIDRVLANLSVRNCFIRQIDAEGSEFRLHHLFHQFLKEKAREELSRNEITDIYSQAGVFCCKVGHWPQALHYYAKAEDFEHLEIVLQQIGMVLLATNQTATLNVILGRIPERCLIRLGWASFFLALARMDSAPSFALPLLDQALTVFSTKDDAVGELLALTHLISVRIFTTGHYQGGGALLERAVQLFPQVADELDVSTTILVARNLAMGCCIFLADNDEATRYASLALNLARKEKLVNFEAALLMVMGYIRIFAGTSSLGRMYMELAAPFAQHPEVGSFNRLAIRMMLFNHLFHEGDFHNYFDQKQQLIDALGGALVSQSIAGPFCYIWEMDIALNQNDYTRAIDLANLALAQEPQFSAHLNSQILQLKGVAFVLQGIHSKAIAAAEESLSLRRQAGGRYFVTLNKILVGMIFCQCRRYDQGIRLLSEGIEDARLMPTEYLQAAGLLHRGAILLAAGHPDQARPDIETGMGLMGRNDYHHFWAWTPLAMNKVLSFAMQQGIELSYTRALAANKLHLTLLEDGTAIPLLDIQTLGGLTIRDQGITLLEAEVLTPVQRELLALLLAATNCKLSQETLQLYFWPDSPQDMAKANFDTLISRLRKTLNEVLPKKTKHQYLNREKGVIWITSCRIDALEFLDGVKRGMTHYRLQEFWQAGNAFSAAAPLWQGEFFPGVTGDGGVRLFRDALIKALSTMALSWSDLLVKSQRLSAAIQIIEKAIVYDPINSNLYTRLYRLEGQCSSMQARQVVHRYKTVLQKEGCSKDEITDMLRHTFTS